VPVATAAAEPAAAAEPPVKRQLVFKRLKLGSDLQIDLEHAPASAAADRYTPGQPAREPLMPTAGPLLLPAAEAGQPQDAVRNESDLVEFLMENVGKGKTSVKDTALTAAAVRAYTNYNGGQTDPAIAQLAAMADQNGERKLHGWLEKASWRQMLPALYEFDVLKVRKADRAGECDMMPHAALLPHEMFASMHAYARPVFENIMTGGSGNLRKWWAAEAENNSSWFQDHPAIPGAPAELLVPIGIHGDDAGVQGQESVTVLTWGSVAVERPTLDSRLIFCMLKESESVKPDSLHKVFKVFAWSLTALAAGVFPDADEEGRPFGPNYDPARAAVAGKPLTSDGHRGCWAEMRGDWKFLHESLRTRAYYGANGCCHLCAAVKSGPPERLYSNFGIDDELRATCVTSEGWLKAAVADPGPVSPLLHIPGFCIWRVHFDIMHTLDLGVLTHALPSALTELTATAEVFHASTREGRLQMATQSYRLWCKAHKIASVAKSFGKRWCEGPYPCIGQFQAKAAAIRSMVYWFKEICNVAAAKSTLHGRLRATMMDSFVEADEIQRRSGRHLLPEARLKLAAAMERALRAYNALAAEAIEAEVRLWRLTPKHHAMTHIAYDNGGTNPRKTSCYLDEDMVGRMKRIYVMCHGSTAPYTSLRRYIILCGLRWKKVAAPAAAVAPARIVRHRASRTLASRPY
jgi:hypothetical protein